MSAPAARTRPAATPGTAGLERTGQPGPRGARHDVPAVVRVEVAKLAAQVRVRLALAVCVLGPFAFALLVRLTGTLPADTVFGRQVVDSAPAVALVVLGFAGSWALPLLVSVVAGDIVSSEDHFGTWSTVLTRSRSRSAVLVGKLVAATAYAVLAVVVLALAATGAGALLTGHRDLVGLSGQAIPLGHATLLALAAWASVLPAALAFGAVGVLVSVASRNSLAGIAAPAALGLLVQLLTLVDGAQRVVAFLPGGSFLAWHGLFASPSWTWPLWRALLVSVVWAVLAVTVARVLFRRRTAHGG